jgi:hypothetical protein
MQDGTVLPVQVDAQGRLVAVGPFLERLDSNRNVLINGNLRINQRGVTIAAAAVGQYGPDRWKKVNASQMTQIVEDVNFIPGAVYTLSGTGVTTQQLTAPASGHWTLPNIPITATNIQLELGTVATPFERRSYGQELALCQRYYEKSAGVIGGGLMTNTGSSYRQFPYVFKVEKRNTPIITQTWDAGTFAAQNTTNSSVEVYSFLGNTTGSAACTSLIASAEL